MADHPEAAPTSPPPRPLGLPELLDRAFQVYRRNFRFFAALAVAVALPDMVVEFGVGSGPVLALTRILLAPLALALLNIGATQVIISNEAHLAAVFLAAVKRYLNFANVFAGYLLALLAWLIPPLGLWLIVRWGLAATVLAAEPLRFRQAFRRSEQLVRGDWWRSLLTMGTIVALDLVLIAILSLTVGVAAAFLPLDYDLALSLIGAGIVLLTWLVIPLVPIGFALLYVDLRVRKEGFDLDYLATSAADAA